MSLATSTLTAQGQISVPAKVRQKLGIGPGSVLEWTQKGDEIVVRKAGLHHLDQTRKALGLTAPPKANPLEALREGIRQHARTRARR